MSTCLPQLLILFSLPGLEKEEEDSVREECGRLECTEGELAHRKVISMLPQ